MKRRLFQVDDDLDLEQADTRNYYRDLLKENKTLQEEEKLQIKMHRGNIIANNQKMTPTLLPPTTARLLTMTDGELNDVRTAKVCRVDEFSEKGSDYLVYVQKVKTINDVQKGLYKMRIKYADATHVSAGYRLEVPKGPFGQSYHDDGEIGTGRAILQAIKDRAVTCVAVYIVRFFGGVKLGKRRFEIVTTLTTAALTTFQMRGQQRTEAAFRKGVITIFNCILNLHE